MFGGWYPGVPSGSALSPGFNMLDPSPAKIVVNDVDGYCVAPSATQVVLHPRWPFVRTSDCAVQALYNSQTVQSLTEAGIVAPDTELRFGKVADPDNPAKAAILYRLRESDVDTPDVGEAQRVELTTSTAAFLNYGVEYVVGVSMRIPAAWYAAHSVLAGNPNDNKDSTLIFQIHGNGAAVNPSMSMLVHGGDGSASAARQYLFIRSLPLLGDPETGKVVRQVWEEYSYPVDVWQHWVFAFRLYWDLSGSPYFKAWRALGDADPVQVLDDYEPNCYHETGKPYLKHGIYYFTRAWTGGLTERVMHSKGMHAFRRPSGFDHLDLFSYLRSI